MSGPIRTRTRRRTGWPTASHIRRIWRLRPSWIVIRSTPGEGWATLAGAVTPSSSCTPSRSVRIAAGLTLLPARDLDLGEVLLLDARRRMGDAVGQLAVVGEQQQALGVGVEAPDWEHPRLGRDELDDRPPPVRVAGRRDDSRWLVEQVVDETGTHTDGRSVDLDEVGLGVDPTPEHGDLAVHAHPSGGDQLLADPPAAPPGGGEHLLQPFTALIHRASGTPRLSVQFLAATALCAHFVRSDGWSEAVDAETGLQRLDDLGAGDELGDRW